MLIINKIPKGIFGDMKTNPSSKIY